MKRKKKDINDLLKNLEYNPTKKIEYKTIEKQMFPGECKNEFRCIFNPTNVKQDSE